MAQLLDGQPAEMGCRLAGGEIIECRGRRRSWRRTCDLLVGAGDAMGMTAGVRLRLRFTCVVRRVEDEEESRTGPDRGRGSKGRVTERVGPGWLRRRTADWDCLVWWGQYCGELLPRATCA